MWSILPVCCYAKIKVAYLDKQTINRSGIQSMLNWSTVLHDINFQWFQWIKEQSWLSPGLWCTKPVRFLLEFVTTISSSKALQTWLAVNITVTKLFKIQYNHFRNYVMIYVPVFVYPVYINIWYQTPGKKYMSWKRGKKSV